MISGTSTLTWQKPGKANISKGSRSTAIEECPPSHTSTQMPSLTFFRCLLPEWQRRQWPVGFRTAEASSLRLSSRLVCSRHHCAVRLRWQRRSFKPAQTASGSLTYEPWPCVDALLLLSSLGRFFCKPSHCRGQEPRQLVCIWQGLRPVGCRPVEICGGGLKECGHGRRGARQASSVWTREATVHVLVS